jgi:4-carboxymuconolactone decarboxylase
MSDSKKDIAADLAKFRDSYVELFGFLPPLPAARFEFSGDVNPEFLHCAEKLREHAFYSDVFDVKTTNLMLFGMLLVEHNQAAQMHALAARRAGVSGRARPYRASRATLPARAPEAPGTAAGCTR